LNHIGEKYRATAHQVALSWLLHHADNILLIPGTSKVKHLEENYKALDMELSEENMRQLEELRQAAISG
jgi:aryl-alcohol dehydrogenase-like predicted oxidoreductase